MQLIFESIRLKRFRSFLEETTLNFTNAGNGLYFLKGKNHVQKALGSNGAGKSGLLDAFMWCLYGKTVQGLKNPDVTPWTGKGTTEVEVSLLADGRRHQIKRTIAPNLLTIDAKEAGQEYVDRLIGIPLDVIPYTVIMGQRQPLFFDLTASEKLKIFSEPLNLERWETRSQHAAELVRSLELTIQSRFSDQINLQNSLIQINLDIESLKKKKTEWEAEREQVLTIKESEKKKLEKVLPPLQKQRDDADLKLDRAETEIRAIRPSLIKLQEEKRDIEHEEVKASAACHRIMLDQQALTKSLESVDEGICPTCNQPLKTHKKTLQKEIDEKGIQLAKQLELAVQRSKLATAAYEKIQLAVDKQIEAQEIFEKDAEEARDVLDKIGYQLAQIEAAVKLSQALIEKYENEDNPYKDQITTLRKRKSDVEASIVDVEKLIVEKKERCERVRPWVKWFKDIKLYALEEILQELQITTNALLEEFGLVGWSVVYDIERETKSKTIARGLNIAVYSPSNSKSVKWESFSGGEAQRLRIIGSVALGSVLLNHLGVQTNLAVFDEPTESLSKEGVVDLVELLANYAKDTNKDVWLVDHHTVESSHFVDVIEVNKDKRGSFIT